MLLVNQKNDCFQALLNILMESGLNEKNKSKLIEGAKGYIELIREHIFKEDNILYQIALQVLSKKEWKEVKKGCDKIGYCCFTPSK